MFRVPTRAVLLQHFPCFVACIYMYVFRLYTFSQKCVYSTWRTSDVHTLCFIKQMETIMKKYKENSNRQQEKNNATCYNAQVDIMNFNDIVSHNSCN